MKTQSSSIQQFFNSENNFSNLSWVLLLITILLFSNTLLHGFVLDDIAVIEKNKFVQQGFNGIPEIFTTFYWQGFWDSNSGLYRPMSLLFFAIEWQFMPNSPFIHHFFNLVWYAISVLLLFKILVFYFKNYTVFIPFFIVLLFAVHPIHTEVVANNKSRDEILCFLFFLISVYYFYLKKGQLNYILALISFLCCLLSKEAGILYIPILGFLKWRETKWAKTTFVHLIPVLVLTVIWLCWHQYIIQNSVFKPIEYSYLDNSLLGCTDKLSQVYTGFSILGKYIFNSIVPYQLSYDYSFNQIPCVEFFSFSFLSSFGIVILLLFIIYYFKNKLPIVSFGIIYFFITIFLATNIFILIGATMGDRLLFSPVLGLLIAFVFILFHLNKSLNKTDLLQSSNVILIAVSIIFCFYTFSRNKDWKSNTTLFTADFNTAKNSARVHFNNATVYFSQLPESISEQQKYLPEIIQLYKNGLKIDPNDSGSLTNLGVCYYRMKDYEKSIIYTKKAIQLNKTDTSLLNNLADSYFMNQQLDEAILNYKKIIQLNQTQFNTFNFYGVALFNKKEYLKAIQVFEQGLKKYPNHAEMFMNYGNVLAISGKFNDAIFAFEKAFKTDSNLKKCLYFLSNCHQAIGNNEKAMYYKNEFNKTKT